MDQLFTKTLLLWLFLCFKPSWKTLNTDDTIKKWLVIRSICLDLFFCLIPDLLYFFFHSFSSFFSLQLNRNASAIFTIIKDNMNSSDNVVETVTLMALKKTFGNCFFVFYNGTLFHFLNLSLIFLKYLLSQLFINRFINLHLTRNSEVLKPYSIPGSIL
jgi:hypothetical protein